MGIWETPIKLAHNLNGTLVGMIHIMLPFMVLPLYAAMQRIDRQTMQAASNLGATPIQAFWQIFVPLSLPGVAAGSLIVFILCLGFYVTPAVLGGGKVIMVSMQITAILEDQFNWGAASALGVVLLVTTFIFLLLASRFLKLDSIMLGKHKDELVEQKGFRYANYTWSENLALFSCCSNNVFIGFSNFNCNSHVIFRFSIFRISS